MVTLNTIEKDRTMVRIITHTGTGETKRRLMDMGLSYGTTAEVLIAGKGNSPYLLAVNHSRLVLEKDLASEVYVEEVHSRNNKENLLGQCVGKRKRGGKRWGWRK